MSKWNVQMICCGRDAGVESFTTWEDADAFRENYISGPGVKSPGGSDYGHERSAIVTEAPLEERESIRELARLAKHRARSVGADVRPGSAAINPVSTPAPFTQLDAPPDTRLKNVAPALPRGVRGDGRQSGGATLSPAPRTEGVRE